MGKHTKKISWWCVEKYEYILQIFQGVVYGFQRDIRKSEISWIELDKIKRNFRKAEIKDIPAARSKKMGVE